MKKIITTALLGAFLFTGCEEETPVNNSDIEYSLNEGGGTVIEFTPQFNEDYVCLYVSPSHGFGTVSGLGCFPKK